MELSNSKCFERFLRTLRLIRHAHLRTAHCRVSTKIPSRNPRVRGCWMERRTTSANFPAKKHWFEGRLLTVTEILRFVTGLSRTTVRKHLAAGRNTRYLMLSFDTHARRSKNGKLGSMAY